MVYESNGNTTGYGNTGIGSAESKTGAGLGTITKTALIEKRIL